MAFRITGKKKIKDVVKFMRERIAFAAQYGDDDYMGEYIIPVAGDSFSTVMVWPAEVLPVDRMPDRNWNQTYALYDLRDVTAIDIETSSGSTIRLFQSDEEGYWSFAGHSATCGRTIHRLYCLSIGPITLVGEDEDEQKYLTLARRFDPIFKHLQR